MMYEGHVTGATVNPLIYILLLEFIVNLIALKLQSKKKSHIRVSVQQKIYMRKFGKQTIALNIIPLQVFTKDKRRM